MVCLNWKTALRGVGREHKNQFNVLSGGSEYAQIFEKKKTLKKQKCEF